MAINGNFHQSSVVPIPVSRKNYTVPAIILVEPQMGENIGAAARAMSNFGLHDLRIVAPRDGWPNSKAVDVSAGAANLIKNARVYDRLEEAVCDIHFLLAATVRPRDMEKPVLRPSCLSPILDECKKSSLSCAIMFGGERSGLNNYDISLADNIITIPVSPGYPSMNLAQAVAVIAYEASVKYQEECGNDNKTEDSDATVCASEHDIWMPDVKQATKGQMLALIEHLDNSLEKRGYYKAGKQKSKKQEDLRGLISGMGLSSAQVQALHSIIKCLEK